MDSKDRLHLHRLGWNEDRERQLDALADPTLVPARVGVEHRGAYGLLGSEVTTARLAGRFRLQADTGDGLPAVGDWVAVQPAAGQGVIHHLFPRSTMLTRRRPWTVQAQVVAANVDQVFVVTAPGADLSPRRIERYLAAIWSSGAQPVVVVNKVDLATDAAAIADDLRAVAPGVALLTTSAATGAGVDQLRAAIPARATAALVGSSGVGKSSLLNRLLGEERQVTTMVRLIDDKGRHTTTRRELVELPEGGWVIDTPGMREFGLHEAGAGLDETFTEVEELARGCRFRDCRHQGEPGCAVAGAVECGTLPPERLASYEKLRREEAYLQRQQDARLQAGTKRRWKEIHKAQRARRRVDPKLREDS